MAIRAAIWHSCRPVTQVHVSLLNAGYVSGLGDGVEGQQLLQKPRHILQIDHVRAI
ncbi:hypothetical protein FHX05_000207 [Rhizobium sp. BK491]|nr:hypothetical protein [Rhizobium sp. BK491]